MQNNGDNHHKADRRNVRQNLPQQR
jgi:hypothetical protein